MEGKIEQKKLGEKKIDFDKNNIFAIKFN